MCSSLQVPRESNGLKIRPYFSTQELLYRIDNYLVDTTFDYVKLGHGDSHLYSNT